jgi:hypothetical protein
MTERVMIDIAPKSIKNEVIILSISFVSMVTCMYILLRMPDPLITVFATIGLAVSSSVLSCITTLYLLRVVNTEPIEKRKVELDD